MATALLSSLLASCDRPAVSLVDESENVIEASQAADAPASDQLVMDTLDQRASYSIGYRFGSNLAQDDSIQVDIEAAMAGMRDALRKRPQRLDDATMGSIGKQLDERQEEKTASINASKRQEAQDFLDRNGRREGVVETKTGLQFEILKAPAAPEDPDVLPRRPSTLDRVTVHYHGTLTNGTVFDSSVDRGEPIDFEVRSVIPGWVEALQLMQVGEKRRLFIPPGLGYGNEGAGPVPPNSVLIFDVELLSIGNDEEAGS